MKEWISKLWITNFESQASTLLQAKMAQQGKKMRLGARKAFVHHSVKLVLLANGNKYARLILI
jgi:hypothetical protein